MSFFNTTTTLHHRTPLPPSIPRHLAIWKCHKHDLILRLDPELAHYEPLPDLDPNPRGTKRYKVTDHMHALPKGLWDSTVTFEAQITNEEFGNEYVVKAPLGLVQVAKWTIEPAREDDLYPREDDEHVIAEEKAQGKDEERKPRRSKTQWCLVEDVEIRASILLARTVKSKCEGNWRGVHDKFISALFAANREGSADAVEQT